MERATPSELALLAVGHPSAPKGLRSPFPATFQSPWGRGAAGEGRQACSEGLGRCGMNDAGRRESPGLPTLA